MLIRQNLIVTARRGIVINSIIVKRVNGQRCRELPEGVIRDTGVQERGLLPRFADGRVVGRVGRAVLLEDDRLPRRFARRVVLHDPLVAPGLVVAPRIRVEVEGAVVERRDGEVLDKVHPFVPGVGVRAVTHGRCHPPFVAEGHHVLRIQGFDVRADARGPVGDDRGRASGAARLVAQFPCEDGRGVLVAVDDQVDVIFVRGLRFGVGVP